MFDYIKGTVTNANAVSITVEVMGVGFLIYVSNPYAFTLNAETKIYLYQHIREDENILYGFATSEERELFLKLISVKGIGPKMALPMFATGSISGIVDAIERENVLYLRKFPKVGEKVARHIILDLKGKLSSVNTEGSSGYEELVEVLKGLGYKEKDYKSIIVKVNKDLTIEEQVKEALRLLLK